MKVARNSVGTLADPWVWLAIAMAAATGLTVLNGLVGWSWLEGEQASDWVQAIGSLIGLAIAIAVPAIQHRWSERRAVERQLTERERNLKVFLDLARAAYARVVHTHETANLNQPLAVEFRLDQQAHLRRDLQAVHAMPLDRLDTAYSITAVLQLVEEIEATIQLLDPATQHEQPVFIPAAGTTEENRRWRNVNARFKRQVSRLEWALREIRNPGQDRLLGD